jgi:hypothetical protein
VDPEDVEELKLKTVPKTRLLKMICSVKYLEPVQMDSELLSLFSSKGLEREVCARVCSKFGVSRVSDLSVLEDRDIPKLDLLLVDSRKLEQLVREIRAQGSKGKVPLPHAELQGNMDPAIPRFAITIGNNSYAHFGELKNCRQDAHDMKTELKKLGFNTEMLSDYGKADTDAALTSWLASLPVSSPCVALMYFSGHGLEIDGENFLVPIDADGSASKDDVKKKCVSVQNLLDTMSKKFGGAVLVILLLDCCRENPTKSTKFKGSFSKLDLSSHVMRTFVGYATAPGSLADAGNAQCPNNSPFTYALKDCLKNREIASQVIQPYLKYFWEEWRLRQVLLFIYTHHRISGHSGDFKGTCIFLDDIRSKV